MNNCETEAVQDMMCHLQPHDIGSDNWRPQAKFCADSKAKADITSLCYRTVGLQRAFYSPWRGTGPGGRAVVGALRLSGQTLYPLPYVDRLRFVLLRLSCHPCATQFLQQRGTPVYRRQRSIPDSRRSRWNWHVYFTHKCEMRMRDT